ncbi:MAG: phosphatidylserine decarboxylase [Thermoplasmata archaeon]|nr:phosphatidylserine decarboxylase [Thermoplasmata archaeon]
MIAKKCIHIALFPLPFLILSLLFIHFHHLAIIPFFLLLLLQIFFLYFFRDVERHIEDGIISPADGKILYAGRHSVSIFMSIFDMHVNLMPYDGKIVSMKHIYGSHRPAYGNVEKNERMEIEIESDIGRIKLIQIAGVFARRIVPYIKEGDFVKKGEKIGIIRFGSRVEIILPESCHVVAGEGKKIKAGEKIAEIKQQN